ncbi:monooxygenase 2-like [Telopea speciosissima]|uniref:monooxygenase 2-like n=1 Tax=Telopea speciosissima TaxID=54955 RepID=UPI001CC5DD91|nr:monooxygenase 2-like [Telopea speciosissima]
MEMREEEVVIVGAGISGLATAVALRRVGVRVLVLERWEELRITGAALALYSNAWFALEALGVAHKLSPFYVPTQKGRITNVTNGAVKEVSYSGFEGRNGPIVVHRRKLLESLAEELPPDTIRFSSKLISIHSHTTPQGSSIATLQLEDNTIIKAKVLIGCDGVHSVVGRWLGLMPPVPSGRNGIRGLAVYPQGHGFSQALHQFVKPGLRGGFVPINDKDLYWFLFYYSESTGNEIPVDPLLIQKEVLENLAKDFPPKYLEVVKHSDLPALTCAPLVLRCPWDLLLKNLSRGNITVAGDALHPMTPDLGQGGCSALEDAVVLGRHIGNSFLQNRRIVPEEVPKAINGYVVERRWRVAGLITKSYLSGWAQQGGGSGWLMKLIRDIIFFKLLYRFVFDSIYYDSGKLPSISLPNGSQMGFKTD